MPVRRTVYVDNAMNRKLGRVGLPYGTKAPAKTPVAAAKTPVAASKKPAAASKKPATSPFAQKAFYILSDSDAHDLMAARELTIAKLTKLGRSQLEKLAQLASKVTRVNLKKQWKEHTIHDLITLVKHNLTAPKREETAAEKGPRVLGVKRWEQILKARKMTEEQLKRLPREELSSLAHDTSLVHGRKFRKPWKEHTVENFIFLIKARFDEN